MELEHILVVALLLHGWTWHSREGEKPQWSFSSALKHSFVIKSFAKQKTRFNLKCIIWQCFPIHFTGWLAGWLALRSSGSLLFYSSTPHTREWLLKLRRTIGKFFLLLLLLLFVDHPNTVCNSISPQPRRRKLTDAVPFFRGQQLTLDHKGGESKYYHERNSRIEWTGPGILRAENKIIYDKGHQNCPSK